MDVEVELEMENVKMEQPNWSDLPWNLLSGIMEKLSLVDDYVRFGAVCSPWHTAFRGESSSKKQKHSSLPFLLVPCFHQQNIKNRKRPVDLRSCQNNNNKKRLKGNQQFGLYPCKTSKPTEELDEDGNAKPKSQRGVYSVARKTLYQRFQVRVRRNKICRGSSFGWLVTLIKKVHQKTKLKYYVQLQNPFLPNHDIIHLPTLPIHETDEHIRPSWGVEEEEEEDHTSVSVGGVTQVCELKAWDYDFTSIYLQKAVLSTQPDNNHNKNFIVMAILTEFSSLAFFDPADKASFCWTPVGDWKKDREFDDVIFFSKTQQFYAVKIDSGAVFAIDIIEKPQGVEGVTSILQQIAPSLQLDGPGMFAKRYIVELPSGDLLQVIKFNVVDRNVAPINDRPILTTKFKIFKLDAIKGGWIRTYDLSDTILFLGINASISRSTLDFPECKPNCIYFADDKESNGFYDTCIFVGAQDMGIYNLHDGILQPHFPLGSTTLVPQANLPIWLEPTLRL